MDTLLMCVAGLDVHKKSVWAAIRKTDPTTGNVSETVKQFGTMTPDLLALVDWLSTAGVRHVAMESTGIYWKPIWNILEERFSLLLANPRELKQVPGRKSDVRDCQWIAHLLACGLLTASFVPDRTQREVRDLTRLRARLEDERIRTANRIHKVLEDANLKLASVASDIFGKSGREMLAAICKGIEDAKQLSELAYGRLRAKLPELQRALAGRVTEHHRYLLGQLLQHFEELESQIAELDRRIAEVFHPFADEATIKRLDALPGVNLRTIQNVLAEIGVDMRRFPTAGHLCSWAGLCPGNEESAGRRKHSATTKGNRWLRRALCEAARAASRKKDSYFLAQYRRLASRRGANRASLAVAHSLLVVIYELLSHSDNQYRDLGATYFDQLNPQRVQRYLVKRLEALGYQVSLTTKAIA
jgi:transposase